MPRLRKQSYQQRCQKRNKLAAARREVETPEQRALRLEKTRIRAAVRRACESEEERGNRLARERTRINAVRARLKQKAKAYTVQQSNQTSATECKAEKNTTQSGFTRTQNTAYNAYITLKAQREVAARKAAIRRSQETPEKRATRLEKSRIRAAYVRSCEDDEKRAIRLYRQRIRTNAARAYLKFKAKRDALLKLRQQASADSSDQDRSIVGIDAFNHSHKETTANNVWERARTIQFQQIYQRHIAFQACLLLGAQRQGIDFPFPGSSISEWQRYPAYYNLPYRTNEKEDQEVCAENDNTDPLAVVDVECEVSIEEGDELEDSKQFLEQCQVTKDEAACVGEMDSKPVQENMFETVYCDPFRIKEEIPEREYCEDEVFAPGDPLAAGVPPLLGNSPVQHPEPVPSYFTLKSEDASGCLNEVVPARAEAAALFS